jgi:hypothetical protein
MNGGIEGERVSEECTGFVKMRRKGWGGRPKGDWR